MPLRKLVDVDKHWEGMKPKPCLHPEHNPPGHIVLEPGYYEYTCPGCGKATRFYVGDGPSW